MGVREGPPNLRELFYLCFYILQYDQCWRLLITGLSPVSGTRTDGQIICVKTPLNYHTNYNLHTTNGNIWMI